MSKIHFKAKLSKIGTWMILKLPKSASENLPSRGLTMVEGTINDFPFQAALEPDGKGSHWFRVDETMLNAAGADAGDTLTLEIAPAKEWLEPKAPADLKSALEATREAHNQWTDITPSARWDWIRWINATKQPLTRNRRIGTTCDMLKSGKRRPCCFNRNQCTEPYVSNNGVLLEQMDATQ
jgi:hypothetical protein